MKLNLNMCFKGDRDYLHGTDMFNSITEKVISVFGVSDVISASVKIHSKARLACDLVAFDEEKDRQIPDNFIAEFLVTHPTGIIKGYLVESKRPVACRNPYDEELIYRMCSITGHSISLKGKGPYSPIEILVTMTKQLHDSLYPSNTKKWLFTGIEVNDFKLLNWMTNITIIVKKNFNYILTKSDIYANNELLGHIYFSRI